MDDELVEMIDVLGCRIMGWTTFALGFRSRKAAARWRFSFRRGVGLAVAILVGAYAGAAPLEASAEGHLVYRGGHVLKVGGLCRVRGQGVYGFRDTGTGANVLMNGHPYLIQGEWSDAENRCSLGLTAASEQTYISNLAQFSNPHYGATVKPRNTKFYSGAYLERLHWGSWGHPVARATGAVNIVDKSRTPYTAHYYPVTVKAGTRRRCGGLLFYTRLHVHFTHHKPHELARNSTFVMNCSG